MKKAIDAVMGFYCEKADSGEALFRGEPEDLAQAVLNSRWTDFAAEMACHSIISTYTPNTEKWLVKRADGSFDMQSFDHHRWVFQRVIAYCDPADLRGDE